jgi:hypothetical protein
MSHGSSHTPLQTKNAKIECYVEAEDAGDDCPQCRDHNREKEAREAWERESRPLSCIRTSKFVSENQGNQNGYVAKSSGS